MKKEKEIILILRHILNNNDDLKARYHNTNILSINQIQTYSNEEMMGPTIDGICSEAGTQFFNKIRELDKFLIEYEIDETMINNKVILNNKVIILMKEIEDLWLQI